MSGEDSIEDFFSKVKVQEEEDDPTAIQETYPGSKHEISRPKPTRRVQAVIQDWDDKPDVHVIKGQQIEFFTVDALSKAVGRSSDVVRKWIKFGYIPQAPYRTRGYTFEDGREVSGKRLYSRGMVEALVALFTKYGLQKIKRMKWRDYPTLPQEIQEAWTLEYQKISSPETEIPTAESRT